MGAGGEGTSIVYSRKRKADGLERVIRDELEKISWGRSGKALQILERSLDFVLRAKESQWEILNRDWCDLCFWKIILAAVSRMKHGRKEAKRKSSEKTLDCHLLGSAAWEADQGRLGGRNGTILRAPHSHIFLPARSPPPHSPLQPPSPSSTWPAHESQHLEQSPRVTALFYW